MRHRLCRAGWLLPLVVASLFTSLLLASKASAACYYTNGSCTYGILSPGASSPGTGFYTSSYDFAIWGGIYSSKVGV